MKLVNPSAYQEALNDAEWLTGTGKIIYDPHRPGLKKKTKWWAILEVDDDLARYYRYWIKQHYGIDLCNPSWRAHISIIRGEKPKDKLEHLWRKYHNKTITFKYKHFARFNGDTRIVTSSPPGSFWFVDVKSDILKNIRDEFEVPSNWDFHLTVGRKWA